MEGYPMLLPLAGVGVLVLMVAGVYLLLRRFQKKALQDLVDALKKVGLFGKDEKGIAVLELIWYIVTIAIPVLGILGGIFGWFAFTPFVVLLGIVVAVSIVLGFITGHLEFGLRKK